MAINWDIISGKWKQLNGDIKQRWGDLTDDELMEVAGNRDMLAGKIQERYGIAKEDANQQIDDWANDLKL